MVATWSQTQFIALFQVLAEEKILKELLQDFTCPLRSIIKTGYFAQVYDSIKKEKRKPRKDTNYISLCPSQFTKYIELGYVATKNKIHQLFLVELEQV